MTQTGWPRIRTLGVDGFLVSFGDGLSEAANRAALAYRGAVERAGLTAVEECSTSLVSTYVRFDLAGSSHEALQAALTQVLAEQDWYGADLPEGRRLWRVPTVFGTELAPQLEEAAGAAGLSVAEAIRSISETRVRVQTIGFAPGQPYLGTLPDPWDIPRQNELTRQIPVGALAVAIRQMVLFSVTTPTGWRHIGQTNMRLFRPENPRPFLLRPGDEVLFDPVSPEELSNMARAEDGGAHSEALP